MIVCINKTWGLGKFAPWFNEITRNYKYTSSSIKISLSRFKINVYSYLILARNINLLEKPYLCSARDMIWPNSCINSDQVIFWQLLLVSHKYERKQKYNAICRYRETLFSCTSLNQMQDHWVHQCEGCQASYHWRIRSRFYGSFAVHSEIITRWEGLPSQKVRKRLREVSSLIAGTNIRNFFIIFIFLFFLFWSKLYSQRILIFIVKLVPRTVRVMVGVRVRVSVSFLLCLLSLCSCTEPVPK